MEIIIASAFALFLWNSAYYLSNKKYWTIKKAITTSAEAILTFCVMIIIPIELLSQLGILKSYLSIVALIILLIIFCIIIFGKRYFKTNLDWGELQQLRMLTKAPYGVVVQW